MKTYRGSCECDRVRIEATFAIERGTFKCNCRICTKGRFWGAALEPKDLRVIAGEGEITRYSENPMHHFCKHCGIKVFGRGTLPDGKEMAVVSLAALDDLDPKVWAAAPVHVFDGKHDRFDRAAEFSAHL
jgi:hypothetical protein